MTNLLTAIKEFVAEVFLDRSPLEQYIMAHNPQTNQQVEELERQYNARLQKQRMV
jgi:hypothetical protein